MCSRLAFGAIVGIIGVYLCAFDPDGDCSCNQRALGSQRAGKSVVNGKFRVKSGALKCKWNRLPFDYALFVDSVLATIFLFGKRIPDMLQPVDIDVDEYPNLVSYRLRLSISMLHQWATGTNIIIGVII